MTPAAIIALIRDVLIVAGVGFVAWHIYHDGETRIQFRDLQAVQKQLQVQAQTVAQWHEEAQNAQALHNHEMDTITAAIGSHRAPVRLCDAARADHVSSPAGASPGQPADTRPADSGSGGRDIRAALAAFETRYESALADCRQLRQSWPH